MFEHLGHEVSRVRDKLQLQSEEMGQLQSEAHRWLGKEEQLNSELQQWMHEISATPSQIRVIELAKSPSLAGPVIPAGQWLGMLILSCLCAGVAAIAVARQPLTFGTTADVAQQLGLPVLGVIPQKSRRRYILRKLKRLQPRIQLLGEMTIAIAALILLVAVIQETRLFPMIVENPFEGVARSIQVFRGQ